jgi:hypothetical protein
VIVRERPALPAVAEETERLVMVGAALRANVECAELTPSALTTVR